MIKSKDFTGQPILNQLLTFLDKGEIKKLSRSCQGDRYVKKFDTYAHVVVMLFASLEGYQSIREVIVGLLANARKLGHLGLRYVVRRSTLSEANKLYIPVEYHTKIRLKIIPLRAYYFGLFALANTRREDDQYEKQTRDNITLRPRGR